MKRKLISILLIVSMLGIMPFSAVAVPPSTGLDIKLNADSNLVSGQTGDITITLTSITDAPEATVDLIYKGASQVDGKTKFSVDLIANTPLTINSKIKINDAEWEVEGVVKKIKDKDNTLGGIDKIYSKRKDKKSSPAKLVDKLPENVKVINGIEAPDILTTAIPPPLEIDGKKNINQKSLAPGESIISGHYYYYTKTGDYRDVSDTMVPAKQFLIQIVDGNGNHLAFGWTDADGYFTVPILNPGAVGIQVRMRSYVAYTPYGYQLMTVVPGGTYWEDTHMIWVGTLVVPDGNVDIGSWTIIQGNEIEGAFWIKDDLDRAFSSIPQQPGSGIVEWSYTSTDGTYYIRGGHIYLEGVDRISPDTVIHEYAHNVMYNIYGNWMPPHDCPSPHYVNGISGPNCGWTEGWADFFPLHVNGNPTYTWASGGNINLETASGYWENGDQVEGRVAGALWDIEDSANDGTDLITDGIGNIWNTFYHQKDDGYGNDNTFPQYWNALKSSYVSTQGARAALYQNTIDYNAAPNTPNSPSPANGVTDQPVSLTLSWNGGDSDLDTVTYTVYLDTSSSPTTQRCQGTSSSCLVSGLIGNTLYNWKVDASDGLETTIGSIWNFRTVAVNTPPNIPTQLAQYKSDGVTGILFGGTTTENTIVAKGGVSDPNSDTVQLEVEEKPIGTAFTNSPNCVSGLAVSSGSTASATCSGLPNGQYHWQARAKDEHGVVGSWLSAGENPESDPDFIVSASITVFYPNGGEILPRGTTQTIKWNYTGSPGSFVNITLLKGGVFNRTINSSTSIGSSGNGSYNWLINSTQAIAGDYKVRITSTTNAAYNDTSDNNFTILAIPSGYSYIYGKVMNDSVGIAGALVITNTTVSTTTDTSGFYSLLVPAGKYNLTATKEPAYYENSSVVVTAISGTTVMKDIIVTRKLTGTISGTVRNG